jgi:hypothetical protein
MTTHEFHSEERFLVQECVRGNNAAWDQPV